MLEKSVLRSKLANTDRRVHTNAIDSPNTNGKIITDKYLSGEVGLETYVATAATSQAKERLWVLTYFGESQQALMRINQII